MSGHLRMCGVLPRHIVRGRNRSGEIPRLIIVTTLPGVLCCDSVHLMLPGVTEHGEFASRRGECTFLAKFLSFFPETISH